MDMTARDKVLLGTSTFAELDQAPLERLVESGCEIIRNPFKRKLTKGELLELLSEDVTGLIAGLETLDREVLEKSKLKVISRCGSGLSNVDLQAAEMLRVKVFSTPSGPTNAVAELTMACLLSLLRQVPQVDRSMHERTWDKRIGIELRDRAVAVIGFGRIGQRVGQLLTAFDAKVIVVDPAYDDNQSSFIGMKIQEALPVADVVTLHASGMNSILGSPEFAIMKQGVFLLNAARGELIDEEALINSLETGKVAGAWLDTYREEPYSGLLCDYPQVILTSHIGSYTRECRRNMEMEAAENLLMGLRGE